MSQPPSGDGRIPASRQYRETCFHPQEFLIQSGQVVCDPDLVTVCTRCGLAFPGQTPGDLLVA